MPSRSLFRNHPWILAVVIAAGAAMWMASGALGHREPGPDEETAAQQTEGDDARRALEVQVRRQVAEPVMRHVSVYGRTAPTRSVGIRAETRGRVVAIGAERGERVEAGEVLLRLDERDRHEVLAEARALVKQREMEYAGRKQLRGNGYVSETQLAEAEAAVAQARAELRRAELDLDYMVVEAPFAGTILERDVEVGDFVDPGDPLLTFVDNTTLIVTASVAEQDVGAIEPGQRASAKLITGQNVTGRLRYVSPVADPATRTFTLEMALPNPDGRLPSGVTAELSLPVGEVMAQRVSPALLTLDDDGKLGLKVVDENGTARFVPTEIVKTAPNGVWLTGLPGDATIITVGQGFVRDGEPVEAIVEGRGTMRAEAGE